MHDQPFALHSMAVGRVEDQTAQPLVPGVPWVDLSMRSGSRAQQQQQQQQQQHEVRARVCLALRALVYLVQRHVQA